MARNLYKVLTEAIQYFENKGYFSAQELEYWTQQIVDAAMGAMKSEDEIVKMLNDYLRSIYERMVIKGGIARNHRGIPRFTINQVQPKLHDELQRRIIVAKNLIKLNKQEAMATTVRRFQGWASSIPDGGQAIQKKIELKGTLKKSIDQLNFIERRVLIDQGHKFTNNLNNILSVEGGAIAGIWHSHWRQAHYDYRENHKRRDGNVYALKNSWAINQGLMKPGPYGYLENITQPGEEVYCRCYVEYLYNLRDLPEIMLTLKGKHALYEAKGRLHAS